MLCSAANPELGGCISGCVDDELPSLLIICGLQAGRIALAAPATCDTASSHLRKLESDGCEQSVYLRLYAHDVRAMP